MKTVTVTYSFRVEDTVTDDEIKAVASNGYVQFVEPVVGWDSSGNEIESDFGPIEMDLEIVE